MQIKSNVSLFTAVKYAYLSVSMNLNMFVMYCHKKLPENKSVKTFCSYDETTDRVVLSIHALHNGEVSLCIGVFLLMDKTSFTNVLFFLPNRTNTYAVLKCTNNSYISEIL